MVDDSASMHESCRHARFAAWMLALITAASLSYDLARKPIQVSDSLVELLDVQESPSLSATFIATAERGAYLRPLRLVQIKALFDLSNGRYRLVYTGFHIILLSAAILLFVHALRVQTWADCAAALFALTVLTGLHTFRGTVREAFPINHFLEMVVLCLLALNFARSRGGWWVDAAAVLTFVIAALTLESGLLVWVVAVTGWMCGMRGVSRRGVLAMTLLLGAYGWLRFVHFATGMPGLEERSSGFLLRMLEPEELSAMFGGNPTWFYAYNVITSFASVLFSEPDGGIFEIPRAWLLGDVPPRLYLNVVSSILATGLIGWAVARRLRAQTPRMPRDGDQLLLIAGAVIVANAAISFAYTKHEIMSVAGAFYALATYVAARHALHYARVRPRGAMRAVTIVIIAATASLWAFRSAGVHHMLRQQAFRQRNDWAYVPQSFDDSPRGRRAEALVRQLRSVALDMRVTNPHMLPRWMDRWWGE